MPFDLAAYCARVGVDPVRPDTAGLAALQQAQLRAVVFENFDPLLGRIPALEPDALSAKIVGHGRGGYCHELNSLFEQALRALGFPVVRMLARVRMRAGKQAPRTHLVLRVKVEGRRFLADAGFGGPGSLMPLDLASRAEQRAPNGTFRLIDDPDSGEVVLERLATAGWAQVYAFDGAYVSDGEVAAANHLCATWNQAPFGSHLMLNAYLGDARYGLFDRMLTIERAEGSESRELRDFGEFEALIAETGLKLDPADLAAAWEKLA
ncbi:MAG: arylamine N-acetyltransferase [Novosphingobium sp.]|nr:arylamine N-acetyltransferase [Novosphingobium sp.]MBO9602998.1 arylamine N-acetyltransferase [Novosphingobium sp.]